MLACMTVPEIELNASRENQATRKNSISPIEYGHNFIIYHTHKNRIKREAMRKAGEPLKPMRT